jgi:hypothetical protein
LLQTRQSWMLENPMDRWQTSLHEAIVGGVSLWCVRGIGQRAGQALG